MNTKDFIERLHQEMPGQHRTFPPLEKEEFKSWVSKFSDHLLPDDFLELLHQSNGIQVWVHEGCPEGYFRLLSLKEIDTASQFI